MNASEDYLKKLIFYFLTFSRADINETKCFTLLMHNDVLCPGLSNRIELILSYFQRYREISYDIQGIKDEGSDVILRYYLNEKSYFICFQIKSFDDLKDKNYLRSLKAQYVDSHNKFNFEDYYIILATDQKKDIDKIRMIKSGFSSIENVTIIDPSQFLFFWNLKDSQVGAIIKSFVSSGDLLIQKARNTIKGLLSPKYILLFFILDIALRKGFPATIDVDDISGSLYLNNIYVSDLIENKVNDETINPYDSDSLNLNNPEFLIKKDISNISEQYFDIVGYDKMKIAPNYDYLKAIITLILEAQIKYEYCTEETIEYLEQLFFGSVELVSTGERNSGM